MDSYLKFLNEPTPENIETVHKASGLQIKDAAAVAGVSFETYRGWRASAAAKNKRTPHVMNWNLYLFELEARRLGFDSLKNLVESIE